MHALLFLGRLLVKSVSDLESQVALHPFVVCLVDWVTSGVKTSFDYNIFTRRLCEKK